MKRLLLLILFFGFTFTQPALAALSAQQKAYNQVRELQRKQQWSAAEKAMQPLHDYVLINYLQYYQLRGQINQTSTSQVQDFLASNPSKHLNNALQRRYLLSLAGRAQWAEYLRFFPKEPASVDLRCYHYQAHAEQGNKAQAWTGAEALWLYGRSRPKACDNLFKQWEKAGELNDELRWQRAVLAMQARQNGLATYLVKRFESSHFQRDGQLLLETYRQPESLFSQKKLNYQHPRHQQVAALAVKRLINKDLKLALAYWSRIQHQLSASTLVTATNHRLISKVISNGDKQMLVWSDKQLRQMPTAALIEQRLRLALKQQDWPQVNLWYARLPDNYQQHETWLYWNARALSEQGQQKLAEQEWLTLAQERSYYGFLAAQTLLLPPQLQERRHQTDLLDLSRLAKQPAMQRITELRHLDEQYSARSEWRTTLLAVPVSERLDYGVLALQQNWQDLAVQSAILSKQWDELSLRFPLSFKQDFQYFANKRGVESSLLFAVARQESALYPKAQSSAGARGLMQLMPATAKETAKKIGFRYRGTQQLFEAQANIRLGSAYLSGLLNRYQGNRALSAAAYNAGPHRVSRWLDERGDVPADVWVETIPFRETRGYVKNVLAYQLIYQHRMQQPLSPVLSETELSYPYGD